jgi:hypothetical protein
MAYFIMYPVYAQNGKQSWPSHSCGSHVNCRQKYSDLHLKLSPMLLEMANDHLFLLNIISAVFS